jgi:anti-anti-sigma factor
MSNTTQSFTSRTDARGSTQVITVGGELDFEAVHRFARSLDTSVRAGSDLVVLDAADLTFIDSRGLGAIVSARNALRAHSGDLVIRNASATMHRLLGIVGLTSLLESA